MKKLQYIYGILTLWLTVVGITFKLNHWPGAGVMLTLGILSLLIIFLPLGLVDNYKKEGSSKTFWLYVTGYLTALAVLGGALFKIMHWPGAGYAILIGLPFPFVVFLPVFLYTTRKIENFSMTKTVLFLFLMAHLSTFSALLALNVSKDALDSTLSVTQCSTAQQKIMQQVIHSCKDLPAAVKESRDDLMAAIEAYEQKILENTGNNPDSLQKNPFSLYMKDSQSAGWEAGGFGMEGSAGERMLRSMNQFKMTLGKVNHSPLLANLADQLLSTEPPMEQMNETSLNWRGNIGNQHLTWTLDYLEGMRRNVEMLAMEAVR